jgi:hypothetical protein
MLSWPAMTLTVVPQPLNPETGVRSQSSTYGRCDAEVTQGQVSPAVRRC